MKKKLKSFISILLVLTIVFPLAACNKKDTSGIGTLTLNDKGNNEIDALGGNDGSDTEGTKRNHTEEVIVDTNTTEGNLPSSDVGTELYENEYFSVNIPSGWTVQYLYVDSGGWMFEAYDPANSDRMMIYYNRMEPFFASESSRNAWTQFVDQRYEYAPVISEPSATAVINSWQQIITLQQQFGETYTFPSLSNFNIISSNTYKGPYAQYNAVESEVAASCNGVNGACLMYFCNAFIYTDSPIQGYESDYYSAYGNYGILLPEGDWDTYRNVMISCFKSLSIKENSSGAIAPEDTIENVHIPIGSETFK